MRWTTRVDRQPWFAWYPVQVESGAFVWLETVLRSRPSYKYPYSYVYQEAK